MNGIGVDPLDIFKNDGDRPVFPEQVEQVRRIAAQCQAGQAGPGRGLDPRESAGAQDPQFRMAGQEFFQHRALADAAGPEQDRGPGPTLFNVLQELPRTESSCKRPTKRLS